MIGISSHELPYATTMSNTQIVLDFIDAWRNDFDLATFTTQMAAAQG